MKLALLVCLILAGCGGSEPECSLVPAAYVVTDKRDILLVADPFNTMTDEQRMTLGQVRAIDMHLSPSHVQVGMFAMCPGDE